MRRLASVFSIVILFLTTFVITACQEEEPTITFNSSEFIFSEAGGEQQIVNLTSNAQWKVVYHPEWLTVSPQNGGEGTSPISMRTTGNNLSADTLVNEIQFQATIGQEKISKSIRVKQLPAYKRELTASVNEDVLVMSHGIAAVIVGSGSIKTIYYYLYPEQEWQSLSGKESDIEAAAKTKWHSYVVTSSAPAVEHIFTDLQPDSRYKLVTLSYNAANQRGTTTEKLFITKHATQPTVGITPEAKTSDTQDGSEKIYKWETKFDNPSADRYYVYACATTARELPTTMSDITESDFGIANPAKGMAVAWGIYKLYNKGDIDDDRDNDIPALNGQQRPSLREKVFMKSARSGSFTFPASDNDKYLQIVAWAASGDGQFSGILTDLVYHVDNGVLREVGGTPPTPATPHTSAPADDLIFESAADNTGKTIQVTSNESWTAKSDATWCKVTPASGSNNGAVTVTVTANTSTAERTANVTIKGTNSNDEIKVKVTQKATPPPTPHTSAPSDPLTFEAAADNTGKTIQVTSNESWTVKSDATWCKVTPASGSNNGAVTVTVTANTSTAERTAHVTIKGTSSNDEITVNVRQKSTPHTLAPSAELTFEAAADNTGKTIQVTSNESWTAKSDATWCKVTPASGSNDGIVTVTVTANTSTAERTANVTIKGTSSNGEITVKVTQMGKEEDKFTIDITDYGNDKKI